MSKYDGRYIADDIFKGIFLKWKLLNFIQIWLVGIGSGIGLSPNRRQVIALTSADPSHWRIYVSPGLKLLKVIQHNYQREIYK